MMFLGIYFLVITLTILTQNSSASVPDDPHPCPVKAPCSCDFAKVICTNLTQTEFPTFTKVNTTWHCWTLVMNYNFNIKRIPARAFGNLPFCSLQIGHNGFEVIEDGALNGSEAFLDNVFMQFNKFKELPNEIARMPNITMLSIHDNPITTLPPKMAFASTLQFLDIGSPEMTTWPDSIRTLKKVFSLSLYKLGMTDLPLNAFIGLEDNIGFVTFTATRFRSFPRAMKRLRKMTDLLIEDNVELTSDGIPDDAFSGMVSLSDVAITNSSITRVPNLTTLPALTHLELSHAPLSQWDLGTLPEQPIIMSVDFSYTDIDHIPAAVRRIRSLFELSLDNTKISQIGPTDLAGLQKLQELSFDHSPLTDISVDAFNDTHLLRNLNLDFTKLPGFPRAIERLPALMTVSLQNITIECSCAELGWMKNWVGLKQFLGGDGECNNIHMNLFEYIHSNLSKCP
ncbi:leucine-rich repeat-containing G-protein coupled receptor 4-like [Argopecten irradians]|uniref:leucine-rich repeat-containing G-protein coupled receptor 4-like n=1 Tax=Argopecten irradians TaxID=31199 RepID=UPI00371DD158